MKKTIYIALVLFASVLIFNVNITIKDVTQDTVTAKQANANQDAQVLPANTTSVSTLAVPILMYHHVGDLKSSADATEIDLTVSPKDFETQLAWFKQNGYESVTLDQVYKALMFQDKLPDQAVVFTFDDGYKDVFDNAVPLLQKFEYVGSFAIATDLLGRPGYGTWADVFQAHTAGMEIISHTRNHLDLTDPEYSSADLEREIIGSKMVLEKKLGQEVNYLVYPFGRFNEKVITIAESAGYKLALTTASGDTIDKATLLTTPRVRVHGQDSFAKLMKSLELLGQISVSHASR